MAYVNIVGLHVTDQQSYTLYRENMTPLLIQCGGSFQFDFEIGRDLKEPDRTVNRLFAISFPNVATKEKFFSDPRYIEIRKQYFNPAVAARYSLFEFTDSGD